MLWQLFKERFAFLVSNSDLIMEYIPIIYTKDGFCINGNFKGSLSIKLDDYKFDFKSIEFKEFSIDYSDSKMKVNDEIICPKFNNTLNISIAQFYLFSQMSNVSLLKIQIFKAISLTTCLNNRNQIGTKRLSALTWMLQVMIC